MTAVSLSMMTFPTSGDMRFCPHDVGGLHAVLRDLQGDPELSTPTPDDLIRRLLRIAASMYTQGPNEETHGATGALSFDWTIALEDARSVEEVIGAASSVLAPRLIERIRYLHSFDTPPVRGRSPTSYISLKCAVLFLLRHDTLPPPSITVTAGGHVLLEWAPSQYRYCAMEFLKDEGVYFLLIHGRKRIRGSTVVGEVSTVVPPALIESWYHGKAKQANSGGRSRR